MHAYFGALHLTCKSARFENSSLAVSLLYWCPLLYQGTDGGHAQSNVPPWICTMFFGNDLKTVSPTAGGHPPPPRSPPGARACHLSPSAGWEALDDGPCVDWRLVVSCFCHGSHDRPDCCQRLLSLTVGFSVPLTTAARRLDFDFESRALL